MKNNKYIARQNYRIATPGSPEEQVSAIIGDIDGVESVVAYALHNAELLAAAPRLLDTLKEITEAAMSSQSPEKHEVIERAEGLIAELGKSLRERKYFFLFETGGWNSVWATSLGQAKIFAVREYGNVGGGVDLETVKPYNGNESEYNFLMNSFD